MQTTTNDTTPDANTIATPDAETVSALFNESHRATYCPEDNKLRLYVGRVPRDEYLKLRAAGWVALPKQREAGKGDFAATWTPSRRDTCLEYAGIIEDEDAGPAERAADRAERFSGYRDKRAAEATGHADHYDAQPSAHGFQDAKKAERAVSRHEKMAERAVDVWSKAEYWTQRTAGVISHALYVSRPDVRMGRIKTLEAELRSVAGSGGEWEKHLTLRLAYENQMLEAQGGRLAHVEIVPGGRIGGKLIVKVCKSNATGRVVSVFLKGPKVDGWQYRKRNVPGADYSLHQFETERMPAHYYTPPTEADLAELAALKADTKAKAPKKAPCPLINPTDADAERLQAVWNSDQTHYSFDSDRQPAKVRRMTQSEYSATSGGTYCGTETQEITGGGFRPRGGGYNHRPECPAVAKVRRFGRSVVILTDKPQKPFPTEVWHDPRPAMRAEVTARILELRDAFIASQGWADQIPKEAVELFRKARIVRLAYEDSQSQYGFTSAGSELLQAVTRETVNA